VCEVYIDSSDFQRQQMYILTSVAVCFVYEKQISFELEFRLSFFRLIRWIIIRCIQPRRFKFVCIRIQKTWL